MRSKWCTQCANQCPWPDTDGPTGAELGLQQTEYTMIARAVEAALFARLSQEFCGCSFQVARSAALLQNGDALGWQTGGDLS